MQGIFCNYLYYIGSPLRMQGIHVFPNEITNMSFSSLEIPPLCYFKKSCLSSRMIHNTLPFLNLSI